MAECRAWMQAHSIRSGEHFKRLRKIKPDNIPSSPDLIYRDSGWPGWYAFLHPET